MLTIMLSKLIEKMESVIIRLFLDSFVRHSIQVGKAAKTISETTSAVQGSVNPSRKLLEKREITREFNHGYWEPNWTL